MLFCAALAAFAVSSCNTDDPDVRKDETPTNETSATTVCLNEINGQKGYKGIELYNYGDKEVSLKGWKVVKNHGTADAPYWEGVEGLTIPAKGFFLIYANKDTGSLNPATAPDGHMANGGLSNKKRLKIVLLDAAGKSVDTFTRYWDDALDPDADADAPNLAADISAVNGSYARVGDHGDTWKVLVQTMGATNAGAEVVSDTIPTE